MSCKPLTKKEWELSVADAFSLAVKSTYQDLIDEAVKAEREACAKVCDNMAVRYEDMRGAALESAAESIRLRGQS